MVDVVRIGMWSGPRNLSTAMMRSWENRDDTVVLDEPLYAAYLQQTGLVHPMNDEILGAGPISYDDAIASCLAPLPEGAHISYQKQMSHHLLPGVDRGWIGELRNVFLLRDPRRVLASYIKKRAEVALDDLGLPQQLELAERLGDALVIDSADFLSNPRGYSEALCRYVDVNFDHAMLSWPAGRRDSDGVWAPAWYDAVEQSTGFAKPNDEPLPPDDLTYEALLRDAMEIYRTLANRRLVLPVV